ncbi:nicotinamide N-methyltransferase-like [Hyla sarda]|uniref:nicotinamide N-methyltransferase-like n=1 Tax=Hyla sarda TaxID=327740 RepID=UPI0024C2837B|nr:nicotinamide N-methyltransferase-like [Hyla sarda]
MDSRGFLQTYFSADGEAMFGDETINFHLKKIHNLLAAGNFKGKTAYDFSIGAIIHQLYTVADFYPEITILKLNETCIMELKKWLDTRTGAFNWAHAHDYVKGLQGTSHQAEINKEEKLKNSIMTIMKFNLQAKNLTDPVVLDQADCIITAWLLDVTCQDQNEYIKNFQKITKLLKPGGLLIYIGCLNATYYKVGKDRHHVFTYDESFLRKNLTNEGFKIKTCEVLDRKVQSDLTDYKQFVFVTAVKGSA